MKDMNIAKLTSQDLPLFNGIVSDLFPGVETPTIDYGKVSYNIFGGSKRNVCRNQNFQISTRFKIL